MLKSANPNSEIDGQGAGQPEQAGPTPAEDNPVVGRPAANFHEAPEAEPIGDPEHQSLASTVRGQIQRVRLDLLARENERLDLQLQQLLEQQKEQQVHDRQWRDGWQTRLMDLSQRVDQLVSQAEATQTTQAGDPKAGSEIRDTVKPLLLAVLEMLDDPAADSGSDAAAVAKALAAARSTPVSTGSPPPGAPRTNPAARAPEPARPVTRPVAPPAVDQPSAAGRQAAVAPPRSAAHSAPEADRYRPRPAGQAGAARVEPQVAPKPQPASPPSAFAAPPGQGPTQQARPNPATAPIAPKNIAPKDDVILGNPAAPRGSAGTSATPPRPAAPAPTPRPPAPGVAAAAPRTGTSSVGEVNEPLFGASKASLDDEIEIEIARLLLPQDSAKDSAGLSLEPKNTTETSVALEPRKVPEVRPTPRTEPAREAGTLPDTRSAQQAEPVPRTQAMPETRPATEARKAPDAQLAPQAQTRPEAPKADAMPDPESARRPALDDPETLVLGTEETPKVVPPEASIHAPKPAAFRRDLPQPRAAADNVPVAPDTTPVVRPQANGSELRRKTMDVEPRQRAMPEPDGTAPKTLGETASSKMAGTEPPYGQTDRATQLNPTVAHETVAHETVAHETVAHETAAHQTAALENEPLPKCLTERWNDSDDDSGLPSPRGQAGLPRDKGAMRWPFRRLRATIDRDHALAERDPDYAKPRDDTGVGPGDGNDAPK